MDFLDIEWGDVDWLGLAQDRDKRWAVMNAVMNIQVPWNAEKLSSGYTTIGLSISSQLHKISLFVC
jgi:hypothetical protein